MSTEASQGISFDAMEAHQQAVNRILQADPSVVQFFSGVSDSNSTGLNNGNAFLHLHGRLRPSLDRQPDLRSLGRPIRLGMVPLLDFALRCDSAASLNIT